MASKRSNCDTRLAGMKEIRRDYEQEAYDISRFAATARSRFISKTQNKQQRQRRMANAKLQDPHGIEAFRILANGMTSGLSSQSTPWFTLTLEDEDLAESAAVKMWLSDVERRMYAFLAKTNFYGAAKSGYAELGLFGTEACVAVEHSVKGMVCHPLTFGEYWVGLSDANVPDSLYRQCSMTVRQAVQTFGKSVRPWVMGCYDRSDYDKNLDIYHAIEANDDHDADQLGSKPWSSLYWDEEDDRDSLLRESGYEEQAFWAPRWEVTGGDTYGHSPAMESLPSLRELQLQTKRKNEAIDLMVHPEKVTTAAIKLTGQPRSIVTAASFDKENVIVPYEMPYQAVAAISGEIDKCKQQIDSLSYADLFNAITNMRGIQPRNVEEIVSRNEEKLTQLGPVIERVSNEKLNVVIDRVFGIMQRGGLLPPAPEELSNVELKVVFVSILTQMQRTVGLGQMERTTAYIGNLAGLKPEAADKLNVDEMVDEYAFRSGAPAKMINGKAEVEAIRASRAQAQQQQQMMDNAPNMKQGVDAARLLAESDELSDAVMP